MHVCKFHQKNPAGSEDRVHVCKFHQKNPAGSLTPTQSVACIDYACFPNGCTYVDRKRICQGSLTPLLLYHHSVQTTVPLYIDESTAVVS